MKNKIIWNFVCAVLLSIISFVVTIIAYPHIPDEVTFITNTLVSKGSVAYVLPCITIGEGIVISLLPLIYRLFNKNSDNNISSKSYGIASIITAGALLFMQIIAICTWLDFTISMANLGIACFGFIVALIGNFMPRFRKGSVLGIYNTWTLKNNRVWSRTHRFSGYIWLLGGIAIVFMVLVPSNFNLWLVFGIFLFCLIVPHIYSYFVALKEGKKNV